MSGIVRSLSQRIKRSKTITGDATPREEFEQQIQATPPIPAHVPAPLQPKAVKKKGKLASLRRAFSHSSSKPKVPTTPSNIENQEVFLDDDSASIKSYESNKTVLNFKPKTPAPNHYTEYYDNPNPAVKSRGPRPPAALERYPALVAAELAASYQDVAVIDTPRSRTRSNPTPKFKEYLFKSNTAAQPTPAPHHEEYANKALPALPNEKPSSQSHNNDNWEAAVDEMYERDEFIEVIDPDLLSTRQHHAGLLDRKTLSSSPMRLEPGMRSLKNTVSDIFTEAKNFRTMWQVPSPPAGSGDTNSSGLVQIISQDLSTKNNRNHSSPLYRHRSQIKMVASPRDFVQRMSQKVRSMTTSERPPSTSAPCKLPNCPGQQPGTSHHYHSAAEKCIYTPLPGTAKERAQTFVPEQQSTLPTHEPNQATREEIECEAPSATPGGGRTRTLTRVVAGARNFVRRLAVSTPSTAGGVQAPTDPQHLYHEELLPVLSQTNTQHLDLEAVPSPNTSRPNTGTGKRPRGKPGELVRSNAFRLTPKLKNNNRTHQAQTDKSWGNNEC
ncbi:uncharacterized protein PAC_16904 [Phialocephala subalpina]|uniref:Uncharacterized protein n=1 Tax=Phialocephala subalpina TaxID=576137 RepID=A0A1L7XPR0_9HELO|nr:uncharacterized protein PAC_16904 [Phialocephala subalpina]